MEKKQKLAAAAAIVAGVGVGAVGGALIGSPASSGASEGSAATAASLVSVSSARHVGGPMSLETAADAIGISVDDLRSALQDGQTIAEVAQANGVDPQTVIDALVAEATSRLDEAVADGDISQDRADDIEANLTDRITDFVNGEFPMHDGFGPGMGMGHGFGRGFGFGGGLETVADVIGISEDDLRAALEDGQTIAEIAEANGVDRQAVVDALVAQATDRIESFVDGD